MAVDVDGQLESRLETVREKVNTILGIKAGKFTQKVESLLVDGHLELTLDKFPSMQID